VRTMPSGSHAARCTAIHGSRSHADPTADVTESPGRTLPASPRRRTG
jgi:hypothetical protein